MKQLIINADDFGMSREVNEGIKQGIDAGVITSVSVMTNMPYFDDAIRYLKKHPEVSVGLHFDITEGTPLDQNNTGDLVREDGNFFFWPNMSLLMLFRKIDYKEIESELSAQYTKLKKSGLPITHIDSHHHIHLYPVLFKILLSFAKKNNIKSLRCRVFSIQRILFWIQYSHSIKQLMIFLLCILDGLFFNGSKEFYEVNNLYDISWNKNLTEDKFCRYLNSLPSGTTEVICHPAILSGTGNSKFLAPRFKGLSILLSKKVRKTLHNSDIQLISKVK